MLLVDMDAFFASVEQRRNPALRGRPIGVIGSDHRTVITTASYEARRYGVKTGMNIYEAKRLCPGLVLVIGDNDRYIHTSEALKDLYLRYTPEVEIYSVDEAFLDITGSCHLFGGPLEVGRRIKEEVKGLFGINATVGIGPNRVVAKLAAELSKPDGLRWIKAEEVEGVLADLPTEMLWGVGRRVSERLRAIGITRCGELGRAPAGLLRARFGIVGERLKALGQGREPEARDRCGEGVRSIGHSTTFPRDLCSPAEMEGWILRLSEMVGSRARRHGLGGRTVSVVVRYRSFETFSRRKGMGQATNDTHRIFHTAMDILNSAGLKEPVRLLGVVISGIEPVSGQVPIFEEQRRRAALLEAVDGVNRRHGPFTLTWAPCLKRLRKGVIAPAWRPSGVRRSL